MDKIIVNRSVINSEEVIDILAPLYRDISHESKSTYTITKNCFTKEQQLMYAVDCYQAEVYNGGHDQFFYNSIGIVWKDTLEALKELGDPTTLSIFLEALSLFGSETPSLIEEERHSQLEELERKNADFEELDDRFYEDARLDEKIIKYIKKNSHSFYFEG